MTAAPMWDGSEVRGILGMPPAGKLSIRLQLHVTTSKANKITLVSVKVAFHAVSLRHGSWGRKGRTMPWMKGQALQASF